MTQIGCLQVLVNGKLVGSLSRDSKPQISFLMPASKAAEGPPQREAGADPMLILDVVVHAMGRYNFGCVWDTKGVQSPNITLNGVPFLAPLFPVRLQLHALACSILLCSLPYHLSKESLVVSSISPSLCRKLSVFDSIRQL